MSFFKSLTQLNRKEGKYFTLFIFFQIKARLKIREQQRQVSKVLLDGLYDPNSPLFMLLGVRTEVVGEIIWKVDPTRSISESQWLQLALAVQNRISNDIICQEVVENWKMFSAQQVEQILVMSEGNDDDDDDDNDDDEDGDHDEDEDGRRGGRGWCIQS